MARSRAVAPEFDWCSALADVPLPEVRVTGQTKNVHPLTRAMNAGGVAEAKAKKILEKGLVVAEGRIGTLAKLLDCHYLTAFRLVKAADLNERAAEIRFDHRHKGPNQGLGRNAPLKRRRAAAA